jgi:DNA mismatch repair protein MutS
MIEYLDNNLNNLRKYCLDISDFINNKFIIDESKEIDTFQSFDKNFIKPGVNKELDDKTQILMDSIDKLEAIKHYFNDCITKYEKKNGTDYVKIHETDKNHFSLLATKRRCNILKQIFDTANTKVFSLFYNSSFNQEVKQFELNLEHIIFESHTASNEQINSPQIKQLCKNIYSIKIEMKDLIHSSFILIVEQLELFSDQFNQINQLISNIDIVYSKATIAKKYNYCKPSLIKAGGKSNVSVKGLRHCLIEHIQQNELYVSNDLCLGNLVDGILLYGTNAVGKTSFIRSLGIAVIMAQAGLYVPCSSMELSPYKYIFTRILGNDNIFKNLSTFAVEMSELRTILRLADSNSLVLGDELCSGTESISAASIFVAGVKTLTDKKSSFIFATHLHEIIKYDEIVSLTTLNLKHMTVIYNREKDVLEYDRKLKEGPGDNMYGLEVCKSLHLPESFLQLAHSIRTKYHPQYTSPLALKSSHYNSTKIVGICQKCNVNMGTEVHHLHHQATANENNIIISKDNVFHKNHEANLMTLCEKCHHEFHHPLSK